MPEVKGIVAATVTPFTSGGKEVDLDWIPRHLEHLRQHGVEEILPLGTTGEGPSLSLWEKKQVIETVMANRGSLSVIVGTGSTALPETIELSRYALEGGADAILVVPPFYFKDVTERGLFSYYDAVFRALPARGRAVLYNIPSLSGVEISDELIDALLREHPGRLLGVKDTSGRPKKTKHYIKRYPQLSIYAGSDELVGPCFRAGAKGAISAVANIFPELVRGVYQAYLSGGDVDAAQARLGEVRHLLKKYPTQSAIKFLLHIFAGLPITHVRPPLAELTADEVARLEQDMQAWLSRNKE